MHRLLTPVLVLGLSVTLAGPAAAEFHFSTGAPDGRMATASRPGGAGTIEIESADDFIITGTATSIDHATFYGLIPEGTSLAEISQVRAEIYRVFPLDSTFPPSGKVLTRANSPSDVAFAERDSSVAGELTFSTSLLQTSFTAGNSVLNGIHPLPGARTGGEGPVTGQEVLFDVNLATPFLLPVGHYFFVPQVELATGDFYWLSAARPITVPGTPFAPDLQSWIRNEDLSPDWLRVGADIVGGTPAPGFNAAFSLDGHVPESASTGVLAGAAMLLLACVARRRPMTPGPAGLVRRR